VGSDPFAGKVRVIVADHRLGEHLTSQRFRVSTRSDRMGYRLEGGTIGVAPTGELISTSVPNGAIQVPPTGEPILLMNDHATTGGYSVGAVVITADMPVVGHLAPGDWSEFERCSLDAADEALRQREAMLGAA
jgi:antagonist of KipI